MFLNKVSSSGKIKTLIVVWIGLQCFLIYHFGIVTLYESEKYIKEADVLLKTGNYTSGNFLFYSTEILLIAFSKVIHCFPWAVVIIQWIFNGISVYLFYKLALTITQNATKTFGITLAFICMFYYQLYNVHLFTESLYFSFGIIYTYLLFSIDKLTIKNSILLTIGLALIYFTRPTGVFFIPSTVVYIILRFYRGRAWLLLSVFVVIGIALLYFLLNFALGSGGEFNFLLPYLNEHIICGVPTILHQHELYVPVEKNSVEAFFYVIIHYPRLFFSLAGRRLLAFFGVIRSYYSLPHNIFIAVYFYSSYISAIASIRKMASFFPASTAYFLCNIFFIAITVMLSCDEWHNRFIFGLLPFFLLLASSSFINKPTSDIQPQLS